MGEASHAPPLDETLMVYGTCNSYRVIDTCSLLLHPPPVGFPGKTIHFRGRGEWEGGEGHTLHGESKRLGRVCGKWGEFRLLSPT